MWGQQRVGGVEQRRADRRLLLEDVDAGAAEMAGPEALGQRLLVDHAAARDVEHDRAGLEPRDRVATDQTAGRPGQRYVDGDDVGAGQELVQLDEIDAVVRGRLSADVR